MSGQVIEADVNIEGISEHKGINFEISTGETKLHGFAIKYQGQIHAFENRCPHLGTQLDWLPGMFMDEHQKHIICSTHGALFEPESGRCVMGPCQGQGLTKLAIEVNSATMIVTLPTKT